MPPVRPDRPLLPLFETLGYHIEVDAEATEAHCVMEVSDLHLNRQGMLHGGVSAALLDTASGITASLAHDPQGLTPFVTLSLTVNYLNSVKSGTLRATGRITGGGDKTKFVSCELTDGDGTLIANSTGVFKRVGPPPSEGPS